MPGIRIVVVKIAILYLSQFALLHHVLQSHSFPCQVKCRELFALGGAAEDSGADNERINTGSGTAAKSPK